MPSLCLKRVQVLQGLPSAVARRAAIAATAAVMHRVELVRRTLHHPPRALPRCPPARSQVCFQRSQPALQLAVLLLQRLLGVGLHLRTASAHACQAQI